MKRLVSAVGTLLIGSSMLAACVLEDPDAESARLAGEGAGSTQFLLHAGEQAVATGAPEVGTKVFNPGITVFSTDFVSAGVGGMRDVGSGVITVSGVTGTVEQALLYWHGPTSSSDPGANGTVTINGATITGTNIGFSSPNCWPFSNSQSYVADVTAHVSGNGAYLLDDFGGDSIVNTNGASLLVFFDDGNPTNNRDVVLFEGNDSNIGSVFDPEGWDVTLAGIEYTVGTASIQLNVADGQSFPDDGISVNGQTLEPAGPIFEGTSVPSDNNGPGNNGSLWDIRTFDVTPFLTPGPNTLSVTSGVNSDCLSLVVAAIDLPAGAAPAQPPTANAGPDQVIECAGPSGALVTLDGSGSSSPDGNPLTYSWSENSSEIATGVSPTVTLSTGVHVIELVVNDGELDSGPDSTVISVVADQEPPSISVIGPSPATVECGDDYTDPGATASDACAGDLTGQISTSNPVNASVPGSYLVTYAVADDVGLSSSASRPVEVVDTTAPDIVCPGPVVTECTGAGQAAADPGTALAADLCSTVNVGSVPGAGSFPLGTTVVTHTAVDASGHVAQCTSAVTVQDTTAPDIACPAPIVVECAGDSSAFVTPGNATASDVCTDVAVNGPSAGAFPLGTSVVTYTATDGLGNANSCTSTITVQDTGAPTLQVTPQTLWPPNHAYHTINLFEDCGLIIQDQCSGLVDPSTATTQITCVSSDEPEDATGNGDGHTTNDIVIVDGTTVRVRSERQGGGDGRVYNIQFTVTDASGNSASGSCPVSVPHDMSCGSAVDSGASYSVCH